VNEVDQHLDRARICRDEGRFDEALRLSGRAVALAREQGLHEQLGHGLLLTAVCRLRRGELAHAEPLLDEAQMAARLAGQVQLEADCLAVKGLALRQGGKLLLASRCYRQALELRPGHQGLLNNLATIEALLGRDDLALPRFLEVAEAEEFAATGWLNAARCLQRLGRHEQAMSALGKAEMLLEAGDPWAFWAQLIRAGLVRGAEGLELAEGARARAVTASERSEVRVLIAQLHRDLGRPELGLRDLDGLGGDALAERAECAAAVGDYKLAWELQHQVTEQITLTLDQERAAVLDQMAVADRTYGWELVDALKRADQAQRTRTRFLASINHDLRTPVTALIGATELLLNTELGADQRQLARMVGDAAALTRDLLGGMLDLRQLESEGVVLHAAPFDPVAAAEEVARLLGPRVASGVRLTVDAVGVPLRVLGDGSRFRQVLLNLVGNAVKFTRQGQVLVHIRWVDELRIQVEDTGPGMASSQLMEPYAKAGVGSGSGLGLAICRGLIEAWGSELTYTSSSAGSIFCFTAPFPAIQDLARRRPARVLVVDDQAVNRMVLERQLKRFGHHPIMAEGGGMALGLVEGVDLVLLDIHMPGLSGWETARALRSGGFKGPILALTADVGAETRARCMESGMDDLLTKPGTGDELHAGLKPWLPE
jgi:signal transduction histidine kinase/CheY-like chemotaxis protein